MFYLNICQIDKHDLMYNNSNNLQILSKVVSNSPDEVSSNCARIIRWNSLLVMSGLNWMVERDECGRPWRLLSKTFIRDDLSLLLLRSSSFLQKDRPVLTLRIIHFDSLGPSRLCRTEIIRDSCKQVLWVLWHPMSYILWLRYDSVESTEYS